MTPDCVRLASSTARARPKSVICTRSTPFLEQDVRRLDVAVDQACLWARLNRMRLVSRCGKISFSSSGHVLVDAPPAAITAISGMTRKARRGVRRS